MYNQASALAGTVHLMFGYPYGSAKPDTSVKFGSLVYY